MFAGKCLADVELTGQLKPHFATFRPNSLGVAETSAAAVSTNEQNARNINRGASKNCGNC